MLEWRTGRRQTLVSGRASAGGPIEAQPAARVQSRRTTIPISSPGLGPRGHGLRRDGVEWGGRRGEREREREISRAGMCDVASRSALVHTACDGGFVERLSPAVDQR